MCEFYETHKEKKNGKKGRAKGSKYVEGWELWWDVIWSNKARLKGHARYKHCFKFNRFQPEQKQGHIQVPHMLNCCYHTGDSDTVSLRHCPSQTNVTLSTHLTSTLTFMQRHGRIIFSSICHNSPISKITSHIISLLNKPPWLVLLIVTAVSTMCRN